MKKRTIAWLMICLMAFMTVPFKALAQTDIVLTEDKPYSDQNMQWKYDEGSSKGTLIVKGTIDKNIEFQLSGEKTKIIDVISEDNTVFHDINISNMDDHDYNYKVDINFLSSDDQRKDVKIDNLNGSGCDYDTLTVYDNMDMTIGRISIGASGNANSYLKLEDSATLNVVPMANNEISNYFSVSNVIVGPNVVFNCYAHVTETLKNIEFEQPATGVSKGIIKIDRRNPEDGSLQWAMLYNGYVDASSIPDLIKEEMEKKGWTLQEMGANGKTLVDKDNNAVPLILLCGHEHKAGHVDRVDPTCTEPGKETTYCEFCDIVIDEKILDPTGHGPIVIEGAKDATYTEEGYTGDKVCQKCGALLEKGEAIPMLIADNDTVSTNDNKAVNTNDNKSVNTDNDEADNNIVETGDDFFAGVIVLIMLISAAGAFLLKKRDEK